MYRDSGVTPLFQSLEQGDSRQESGEESGSSTRRDASEYDALAEELFGSETADPMLDRSISISASETLAKPTSSSQERVLCVACRQDGRLEVYDVLEWTVLFWCPAFPAGLAFLTNCLERLPKYCHAFESFTVEDVMLSTIWQQESALPFLVVRLLVQAAIFSLRHYLQCTGFSIEWGCACVQSVRIWQYSWACSPTVLSCCS